MPAYIVFNYVITDRSRIDELTQQSLAVNEQYGAKVIVGSPVKAVEGKTLPNIVILEFINFEAAQTFYHSPEHQALTLLRNEITQGWATIVPGDSETQSIVESGYFN